MQLNNMVLLIENRPARRQTFSQSISTQSGVNCHFERRDFMMRIKMSRSLRNANSRGRKKWREMVYSNHARYAQNKLCVSFIEILNDFR